MWSRVSLWVMAPGRADRLDPRDGWVFRVADAQSAPFSWKGIDYTAGLPAAAPAYLEGRQVASAPPDWFTTAVGYATEELRGATSALIPVPGPKMGSTAGYKVADYLLQYGEDRRDLAPVHDRFWGACIDHTSDPENG